LYKVRSQINGNGVKASVVRRRWGRRDDEKNEGKWEGTSRFSFLPSRLCVGANEEKRFKP
jgi:hypothetical protein